MSKELEKVLESSSMAKGDGWKVMAKGDGWECKVIYPIS